MNTQQEAAEREAFEAIAACLTEEGPSQDELNRGRKALIALKLTRATLSQQGGGVVAEPVECPNCDGSGYVTVMSDNGPDAHEVEIACPHCGGQQTLDYAYQGVVKLLRAEQEAHSTTRAHLWGGYGRAQVVALQERIKGIAACVQTQHLDWVRKRLGELAQSAADFVAAAPPAPQEPEQKAEPVAWGNIAPGFADDDRALFTNKSAADEYHKNCYDLAPLFAAPQEPVRRVAACLSAFEGTDVKAIELIAKQGGVEKLMTEMLDDVDALKSAAPQEAQEPLTDSLIAAVKGMVKLHDEKGVILTIDMHNLAEILQEIEAATAKGKAS